jgi:hypothetical protein
MTATNQAVICRGNSVISIETLPEYLHPVVIKKPARRHPSHRVLRTLENEYEVTRALNAVEGVRKALGLTVDRQSTPEEMSAHVKAMSYCLGLVSQFDSTRDISQRR